MPRYAELKPHELRSLIDSGAPAIVPWGALEWHGPHLPLGLDGLVAEAFAERLAEQVDGVLLPTQWNPMTTLPHAASLQISTETFRALVRETLLGLAQTGFQRVALVTGHYAQGHMVELYRAARELSPEILVFAATPLEPLGDDGLLDHAGFSEAAQLLAIRPDLVELEALPSELAVDQHAVLGPHPAGASAERGEALFARGLGAWTEWLASATPEALDAHYERAEAQYASYVQTYFRESWEQAIRDWWEARTARV